MEVVSRDTDPGYKALGILETSSHMTTRTQAQLNVHIQSLEHQLDRRVQDVGIITIHHISL